MPSALGVGAAVAGFLLLAGALCLCVPSFSCVRSGPSRTKCIINNLYNLCGAMQQWASDHGRTGAVAVVQKDVAPYLARSVQLDGWVKPVAGERYILRTLTESPEAQLTREVEGRPKGTVFRLGTNGDVQIILPNKPPGASAR